MIEFLGAYGPAEHLQAFLLGSARLFMLMNIAPFFAGTLITGPIRFVIMLAMYLVVHPMILGQVPAWQGFQLAPALVFGGLLAKVLENAFEHNNGKIFGTSNKKTRSESDHVDDL